MIDEIENFKKEIIKKFDLKKLQLGKVEQPNFVRMKKVRKMFVDIFVISLLKKGLKDLQKKGVKQ